MSGIEPETSSLPRKRSTPELHRHSFHPPCSTSHRSGRRGSNPRPLRLKNRSALPLNRMPRYQLINKLPAFFLFHLVLVTSRFFQTFKFNERFQNNRSNISC